MKIVLIGGYLKSGKTTFLIRFLEYLKASDSQAEPYIILHRNSAKKREYTFLYNIGYKIKEIPLGCECCNGLASLLCCINEIRNKETNPIVIAELSGLAIPSVIHKALQKQNPEDQITICTIVDSKRWSKLYKNMKQILDDIYRQSDFIFVTKTEFLTEPEILETTNYLSELFQPKRILCHLENTQLQEFWDKIQVVSSNI